MGKKSLRTALAVLLVILAAGITAYAAVNYGTESDPLITKSYLDGVLRPELEERMRNQVADAVASVEAARGDFMPLTLRAGQRVAGAVGTELLLRAGSATAYAQDGGSALIDTTDAADVAHDAVLAPNHLYMVAALNNGFVAAEDDTMVLIAGDFTLQ